jgi:hypothetical protein
MIDHTPTTETTSPRRRWRFWLLLGAIPPVVLALVGIGWLIRLSSGLHSAIAEADRLDPRWRLEEIEADRFTPPPGQNAADKLVTIQKLKTTGWPDWKKFVVLETLPPPANRLDAEQIAALEVLLKTEGPRLAASRSLIDLPHGRYPAVLSLNYDRTLLTLLQGNREVPYFLKLDVMAKAEAGDADGAIRSCHAAFNAGSPIGDEPNLIAQLIRVACQGLAIKLLERALAQGEPSEEVLAPLQSRLEAAEAEPLLLYALRGERAAGHVEFEDWRNGSSPMPASSAANGLAASLDNLLIRTPGFLAGRHSDYLYFMNGLIEAAKLPPEQWGGPLAAQFAKVNGLPILVQDMVNQFGKLATGCQRNHAQLRCAFVAIAAERHRRARGQWPETPEDLVKAGLLKAVPPDPFTAGGFIQFTRAADGLIVNSTGASFRLWDVAARRQPPLPPKPAGTT